MALPKDIRPKIGSLFVKLGLIRPEDVTRVLAIQEKGDADQHRLFGSILCDLNLITPLENYLVLEHNKKLMDLDEMLIKTGEVPAERIQEARTESGETGMPFISLLLEQGLVSQKILQHILFSLFRIPFRSISDITLPDSKRQELAGLISREEARQHQAVPLVLENNILLCGITDPDTLLFARELDERLPQFRITPLFISFPGFSWFFNMLYREAYSRENQDPNQVDLSLLLTRKICITDTETRIPDILSLFKRYEQCRRIAGSPAPVHGSRERRNGFVNFIREQHAAITGDRKCRAVAYSLAREGARIIIVADPVTDNP